MKIVFDTNAKYRALFSRAECCTSIYDRGKYYVAESFEGIVRRGVRAPRHISVGRFRPANVSPLIPSRQTTCLIPWTYIECEAGGLTDNLHATKTTLEVLQWHGFNLLDCHIVFSGNKSFWIALPSYLMGNPVGSVEHQKALRQRVFLPLMEYPVDENLWDARHLHRMVGSVHEKGGPVKAIAFRNMLSMSFVDAPAARPVDPYYGPPCPALYERTIEKTQFHVPPFDSIPRTMEGTGVLDETEDGVEEGNRNYTAFRRACNLIRRMDEEAVFQELQEWNTANSPPLPDRELRMCVRSAKRTSERDSKRAA